MAATSVVIIRETGGQRRQVDLVGAALPFMGAAWGGSLVLSTNWNPGNPNATQQVLVAQEAPSAWEGEWNTNRLVSTPPQFSVGGAQQQAIVRASTLRTIIEDIFRTAQELVVTWIADDNRRITRFGRAKSWDFKHRGMDDIHWNINFEWTGRGVATPSIPPAEGIIATGRSATLRASDAAGYAAAQKINADHPQVPRGPSRFTLGQREQLAGDPQALVASFTRLATAVTNRLRHVTDILVKAKDHPAAVYGLALSAATDSVAVANDFMDRMSRPGPEQQSNEVRVASLLRAARYYGGAQTQAQLMASESLRLARAARQRRAAARPSAGNPSSIAAGDMLQTYLPKQGDTMISLAVKFYGDGDLAGQFSRVNGLPQSTITPPRRALIVPPRQVLLQQRSP